MQDTYKGAIADRIRVSEMRDKRKQRKDRWNDAKMKGEEDGLGLHERGGDGWLERARIESHEAEGVKEDPFPLPIFPVMDMMEDPCHILLPEEESEEQMVTD